MVHDHSLRVSCDGCQYSPDSWGVWFADDPQQIPWQRFLDEVAEAGYEWIELGPYGYLPTDLNVLRAELDKRQLKVAGTFLMAHLEDPEAWPELESDLMGAGELLAGLDAKFLVLIDDLHTDWFTGKQIKPERLDDDAWKRLIDTTHKVAEIARVGTSTGGTRGRTRDVDPMTADRA